MVDDRPAFAVRSKSMKPYLLLALLLAGCETTGTDTQVISQKLQGARTGLTKAQEASDRAKGHVGAAQSLNARIDSKSMVILEWLQK